MTKENFSEYCMVANSSPHPTIQMYITCYKSLFKLLLADLTKWEKVPYITIVTVFLHAQDGRLLLGVQTAGKTEDRHHSFGITTC